MSKSVTLSLSDINFLDTYRTSKKFKIVDNFLKPCWENSLYYDRAAGYFTSGIFSLLQEEVKDFAERGGKFRLICSTELSPEDIQALQTGYSLREELVAKKINAEIADLLEEDDEKVEILATLVALGILDIKIAVRDGGGIYHEKLGIFKDNYGNIISFKGSANETNRAWSDTGNYESIDVFRSWIEGDHSRCIEKSEYFDNLWDGNDLENEIQIIPFPEASKKVLIKRSVRSLSEINWERLKRRITADKDGRSLFPHQDKALTGWAANNFVGIFKHATGSGKTFTAITAIKKHFEGDTSGPVLVLVPSKLLLNQWDKEIRSIITDIEILLVGAGNSKWKKKQLLLSFINPFSNLKRVIIAIYDSAADEYFYSKFGSAKNLLLIADECHKSGSSKRSNVFKIDALKKIGLSATPERHNDEVGTDKIMDYFGGIIEPPYELRDAIKDERLVPYIYKPEVINLLPEEEDEWLDYTKKIKKKYALLKTGNDGAKIASESYLKLLFRRKEILKKCHNKIAYAKRVLVDNYQLGQKWLIYCQDTNHLEEIKNILGSDFPCEEYHSNMKGSQEATLDYFNNYPGIMLSIKCLDEGVDIPDISHALILASSSNPCEFIQRRGRVLRKADGKSLAVIHDAIVAPSRFHTNEDEETKKILKTEIKRAVVFAKDSLNKESILHMHKAAAKYGLEIN